MHDVMSVISHWASRVKDRETIHVQWATQCESTAGRDLLLLV